jgi:DNA-binding NtrC family response regulator
VLAEALVASTLRNTGASATDLRLQAADLEWAKRQPWPGNVRELERLVWRWVYEEGERPLREIQNEYPQEDLGPDTGGLSIKPVVRTLLSNALERRERLSASVGEFSREVERKVQSSLYELKEELALDRRALSILFGDGDRAAKQISAWGEKLRSL